MNRIMAFVFCFLSVNTFCLQPLIYQVQIDPSQPNHAHVSVDTSNEAALTFLPPRFFNNGEHQPALFCEKADSRQLPIIWGGAMACERVIWQMTFYPVSDDGLDASLQQNAFSASQGWHLLTEWNALPRIKEKKNVRVCFRGKAQQCQDLPAMDDAPLLMIDGMQKHAFKIGKFHLNLLYIDPQIIEQLGIWLPVFIHQINYLQAQFVIGDVSSWNLAWFKRERKSGQVGGASGYLTFLANYPVEQGVVSLGSYEHLLKISAHEMIHHLFYLPHALWINESLAEYYAISSLKGTRFDVSSAVNRWWLSAASFPLSDTGLLQAAYYVEKEKNYAYYGLFYTKGAAFWGALDEALQKRNTRLHGYLYLLKGAGNQKLPKVFVEAMVAVIGMTAWSSLENQYF